MFLIGQVVQEMSFQDISILAPLAILFDRVEQFVQFW